MWRIYEVDDIYSSFLEFVQQHCDLVSLSDTQKQFWGNDIWHSQLASSSTLVVASQATTHAYKLSSHIKRSHGKSTRKFRLFRLNKFNHFCPYPFFAFLSFSRMRIVKMSLILQIILELFALLQTLNIKVVSWHGLFLEFRISILLNSFSPFWKLCFHISKV